MAVRKSRADFKRDDNHSPYELALDTGEIVSFANPRRLSSEDSFSLASNQDPYYVCQLLLGDDFPKFWEEWRGAPADETDALLSDVFTHYEAWPQQQNRAQRRAGSAPGQ